ncbi:MAG: hypothetical protein HYU66_25840, partial [Armatimonadetes bacterium]|nr:hypothetical protein [Armatimonadota bacterium]
IVRLQLPDNNFLHLDEVEVYGSADPRRDLALEGAPEQSSPSTWSKKHPKGAAVGLTLDDLVSRGLKLADDLAQNGVDTRSARKRLAQLRDEAAALPPDSAEQRKQLFLAAHRVIRDVALANPLLDFDRIVFAKQAPGSFSHMSDQYYGWWSRPGGGLYVLEGFRTGEPRVRCLTEGRPAGSYLRPDLSADGRRVLFGHCVYHAELAGDPNKLDKAHLPEDAFYHLFELDFGSGAIRQLTHGKYDDFDGRYLPDGRIVFLSTRRGQAVQCTVDTARASLAADLPDSYVRCGGGPERPVAVYTLHSMDADGGDLRPISAFEMFEWTPSVTSDGRVMYARWDYIDRSNMPYMSLWSTHPDGTHPELVYGNFTTSPHSLFEARSIPGSAKLVATASAHHCITGGSLLLIDPRRGREGEKPLTRLTPEVCFPESEGWPGSYYLDPYPLSERYFLTAWSDQPLNGQGTGNPVNAAGLYLYDAFGNLELLYRDPDISSVCPLPLRSRTAPPVVAPQSRTDGPQEGRFLLLDVYQGLTGVTRGAVKRLRVVGVPAKTHPTMNFPNLGITSDDPGKFVLGTVPVDPDGSAWFRAPSGTLVFFQALDADGLALQTMRTATYLQPGQTLTCVGCHDNRQTAPPNLAARALAEPPARLTPGPPGSWPLRFDTLVQPVLDARCVSCHQPGGTGATLDLRAAGAYGALTGWGRPSLRDQVSAGYGRGYSLPGGGLARDSALWALLRAGHHGVSLSGEERERLTTWMDTYAQRQGAFDAGQEAELVRLRGAWAGLLASR